MTSVLSDMDRRMVDKIVAERPWANFWFYFYSFIRDWVATLFSFSVALAVGLTSPLVIALGTFALVGDLWVQRVALDRNTSDEDLAISIFRRQDLEGALDAKIQAKLIGAALLFLLIISGILPLGLKYARQSGGLLVDINTVDEVFLATLIFTNIVVLLAASRCVEVIPPAKDDSYDSRAETWTVSLGFSVYEPLTHDALLEKPGTYFRWNGLFIVICFVFLSTTDIKTMDVMRESFTLGQVYGEMLAFHIFSLLVILFLVLTILVPWRMRGYAILRSELT